MGVNKRWKKKGHNILDFHEARNGDHAVTPFECDICIFRKLKRRNPIKDSHRDKLLCIYIRRMNLDALWSRARKTVSDNTNRVKHILNHSEMLGLQGPFEHHGPYPYSDHCGYEIAIDMLVHSRRPGKNEKTHTQYDTIRQLRTSYSSQLRSSPLANLNHLALLDSKGHYTRLVQDKCGSLWFSRFLTGMKARMGGTWKRNKAMSHNLILLMFEKIEEKISEAESQVEEHNWIVFSAYTMISYVLSLRGNEGLMLEISGLRKDWTRDEIGYVIVCLQGKIKGEVCFRKHKIPCINETNSGLRVKFVLQRLITLKEKGGFVDGPAISDTKGFLLSYRDLDGYLHEILKEIYSQDKYLFPPSISSVEDVEDFYRCFRTFRRTSATRAMERKVDETTINLVNKWDLSDTSKRKKVASDMKHYYAQFELLLSPFLDYTREM